jgi:hypothetical protein
MTGKEVALIYQSYKIRLTSSRRMPNRDLVQDLYPAESALSIEASNPFCSVNVDSIIFSNPREATLGMKDFDECNPRPEADGNSVLHAAYDGNGRFFFLMNTKRSILIVSCLHLIQERQVERGMRNFFHLS